jgi:hypothetical protein
MIGHLWWGTYEGRTGRTRACRNLPGRARDAGEPLLRVPGGRRESARYPYGVLGRVRWRSLDGCRGLTDVSNPSSKPVGGPR